MTIQLDCAKTVETLVSCAEAVIDRLGSHCDTRAIPSLAIDLCALIRDELSEDQNAGLKAARAYLESGDEELSDASMAVLAVRVGRPYPATSSQRVIAIDRLVWIALNRHGELSGYTLEFTLSIAEEAGISPEMMIEPVERMLSAIELG